VRHVSQSAPAVHTRVPNLAPLHRRLAMPAIQKHSRRGALPTWILFFLSAALLAVVGCSDSTEPVVPAAIQISGDVSAFASVGETRTFQATVLDKKGGALGGVAVSWSSSAPNILEVNSSTGQVIARANGSATLMATAGGVSATRSMTVTQVPAGLQKSSGDVQTGDAGAELPIDLVVRVTDAFNNPVSGVSLSWAATEGGGQLSPTSSTTDMDGRATTGWTLGQLVGNQTATATASGLPAASFSATALAPPVAEVQVSPSSASVAVGGTAQLTAVARSASGLEITGVTFNWSSANLAVATVDGTGKVTGSGAGTTTISAEASGIAGTSTVTVVGAGGLTIQSVNPDPMIEGEQATITGTGFSSVAAENQVTIGGLAAQVTSASATQLHVTVPFADCMPPRTGTLSVSKGGSEASTVVTVRPLNLHSLDVGYGLLFQNSAGCLNLAGGSAGEEYLVGILSASEVPSSLTPAFLRSRAGIPLAPSAAMLLPEQGVSTFEMQAMPTIQQWPSTTFAELVAPRLQDTRLERHWEAEARLRQQEQDMIRSMGGLDQIREQVLMMSPGAETGPTPVPAVGEVVDLYHDAGCDTRPSIQAVVRYVGSGGIWLEDVGNPGPAFTQSELQGFDALLTSKILSTLQSHFGSFVDVDGNGRVLVLITKEVNKKEGFLGYVWSGDLYPRAYCARSNQAEIFYGIAPDPNGTVGPAISKQQVLNLYPSLIAHELTHIIQRTEQIYRDAGSKSLWEMEGGATLAEKLVGHQVLGYSSRSDLGWSAVTNGWDWYSNWVGDLASFFGWSPDGRVPGAPEQCTWTGRPEDGNAGPCYDKTRAVYGVPAWLLQFVLDYYGPSYPGGETAAMRRMTQSGYAGFSTLEDVTGESIKMILTMFGSALYTDGRYWNALASWDLFDIFSAIAPTNRLQPYSSSTAEPQLDVLVRGGSTAYLLWSPGGAYNATAFRVRTSSGTALPSHMAYWVMRLK